MREHQNFSRKRAILRMAILDFLVFVILLNLFAYFHHVRPAQLTPTVIAAPAATPGIPVQTPQPTITPSSVVLDETPQPTATPEPTPDPRDLLEGRYAERFSAEPLMGENTYTSENISITLDRVSENGITYYVADIYLRDISCIRTAVAQQHGKSNRMPAKDMARLNHAILAINGDFFAYRKSGNVAVRNGEQWIRKEPLASDILVLYYDGSMEVYYSDNWPDLDAIYARSPYQIWCFGPVLVENGAVPKNYNTTVAGKNPRAAIGYYEPGHYCFVLVDGRQKGYSIGMTMRELSNLFVNLGCEAAFNLDGGDTAVMIWNGEIHNRPEDLREVSDIIYIGEPLDIATLQGD
ncbi:MAG: phosphodiester glycosidase family protein [Clostridia bacterium]|nr:phosphodiester glycosidase family protein [Clostridia bacterium]